MDKLRSLLRERIEGVQGSKCDACSDKDECRHYMCYVCIGQITMDQRIIDPLCGHAIHADCYFGTTGGTLTCGACRRFSGSFDVHSVDGVLRGSKVSVRRSLDEEDEDGDGIFMPGLEDDNDMPRLEEHNRMVMHLPPFLQDAPSPVQPRVVPAVTDLMPPLRGTTGMTTFTARTLANFSTQALLHLQDYMARREAREAGEAREASEGQTERRSDDNESGAQSTDPSSSQRHPTMDQDFSLFMDWFSRNLEEVHRALQMDAMQSFIDTEPITMFRVDPEDLRAEASRNAALANPGLNSTPIVHHGCPLIAEPDRTRFVSSRMERPTAIAERTTVHVADSPPGSVRITPGNAWRVTGSPLDTTSRRRRW